MGYIVVIGLHPCASKVVKYFCVDVRELLMAKAIFKKINQGKKACQLWVFS